MHHDHLTGHLAALFTIFLWGTTFISTKLLLTVFQPVEILVLRFLLGFFALLLACPKSLGKTTKQQEGCFALAGLCGICLYYLLENIALACTMASNVGVIVSVAPFFTALLTAWVFRGSEAMGRRFFLGFLVAMTGIFLISFHGSALAVSPKGDLLALLAAVVWAVYSVLTKHIGSFGFPTVLVTRRTFFYGLLFMVPALPFFGFSPDLTHLGDPVILGNLLFLGLGASALCFVTWNFSVRILGPVKTSLYIYMIPVVTVITSLLVLHEVLTPLAWLGVGLTLAGLFLSQSRAEKTEG